jgi:hypothetical protein
MTHLRACEADTRGAYVPSALRRRRPPGRSSPSSPSSSSSSSESSSALPQPPTGASTGKPSLVPSCSTSTCKEEPTGEDQVSPRVGAAMSLQYHPQEWKAQASHETAVTVRLSTALPCSPEQQWVAHNAPRRPALRLTWLLRRDTLSRWYGRCVSMTMTRDSGASGGSSCAHPRGSREVRRLPRLGSHWRDALMRGASAVIVGSGARSPCSSPWSSSAPRQPGSSEFERKRAPSGATARCAAL